MILSWMNLLLLAAGVTALGAVLTWLGVRGRRVGDHPYCRRCGFDLFGKADDSHVCSECGADLRRPRAMVTGLRVRRKRLAWTGAVLLVPAMVVMSILGYGAARGVDWQKHKPAWWLAREATSSDIATRDAALVELLARLSAGSLSKEQVKDLVRRGLKAQGNLRTPWTTAWGDLIEMAHAAGDVSDERWKTYARQSVMESYTLHFRPRLSRQDPVPYRIDFRPGRAARRTRLWQVSQIDRLIIGGQEVESKVCNRMTDHLISSVRGGTRATQEHWDVLPPDLKTGVHKGAVKVQVVITAAGNLPDALRPMVYSPLPPSWDHTLRRREEVEQRMGSWRQQLQIWAQNRREAFAALRDGPRAQGTTEIELPFEFELVPAGTSTVEAVIDPALRDRVAAAISVRNARVMGSRIDLSIETDPPPIDLGFDVFVRAGEREWRAGILTATAAYPFALQRAVHLRAVVREDYIASEEIPDSSSVEVILRPSAEAAIRSPDIVRYWGEEVSIRRVRLFNPMQRTREMKAIADAHRRRAGGVPSTAPAATSTAPANAR